MCTDAVTVDYQQIANGNIANQIHEFTIDYGKFILILSDIQSNLNDIQSNLSANQSNLNAIK